MSSAPERIFALLIGINTYQSPRLKNLKGCVNDTYSMRQFLLSLRVPESNIRVLKEEEATRQGILTAFESHLINNPAIRDIEPQEITGDTLIFFFAGHGSLTDAPPEWETSDGRIEIICPHDEWMTGPNGPISGIPSRTVHGLFRRLAAKKGNNITAIFDSCHSGRISDSRQTRSGDILIGRSVDTPCPITDSHLDEQIWTDAERVAMQVIPREFLHPSMSSHVLLAACKQEEVAYEAISLNGDPCGAFTNALITTLYKIPLHRMSYNELVNYLPPLTGQVPQCGGEHVSRTLFGVQARSSTRETSPSFPVTKRDDGTYEVGAGLIHGVVRGTEFVLQTEDSQPGDSSWFLVADSVLLDSSTLAHRVEDPVLPEDANFSKAILSSWNNDKAILKVFIDPGQSFLVNQAEIPRTDDERKAFMTKQAFARVPFLEDAHISISYEETSEELAVERLDQIIGGLTRRTVRYSLPRNELWRLRFILESIALFRYHLLRPDCLEMEITHEKEAFQTYSDGDAQVQMHLYRLGGWHEGRRVPEDDTKDLLVENKAEIQCEPGEPSEQPRYGFEVTNHTRHAFYPFLFYFDPSDYSIESWYHPFSKRMTAPLHPFREDQPGKLTVGYGSGGGDPIIFVPETGQTRDTGFVKLFVSNISVDMSHIRQPPAIGAKEKRKGFRTKEDHKIWGTTLAAVTAVAAPES